MVLKFFTCKFLSFFISLSLGLFSSTTSADFLDCISREISTNFTLPEIVFTPNDSSYSSVLESTIQNLRFATTTTPKPLAIITPLSYSHVQSTVICSRESGLQIRTRSGGHDYEGLSYTTHDQTPFILLDINNLRSITVDLDDNTAWVESGATLGELSYWVSQKSKLLGFPTGECTSVGVGGQISGEGYGTMARKYGLSADNVVDALIVDKNAQILDRASMGEDLFWAIRGGGGGSFGVVLSWKINLVYVPPIVTVFTVSKQLDKDGTQLVNKWQYIAHNITDDLFINLVISPVNKTMQVTFNSLFLGTADKLMETVSERFPELGLQETDCMEMSWIESVVYHSVYLRGESVDALIERRPWPKSYYKFKSDYVQKPIAEGELEEIWKWCLEENLNLAIEPHGGRMSEIEEREIPYPHREGNLYIIQYVMQWTEEGLNASEKHVASIRKVYENMTPFVSKNPRQAYVNFRDLDLGTNGCACGTSYLQALKWGRNYFKGNFRRLAMVKDSDCLVGASFTSERISQHLTESAFIVHLNDFGRSLNHLIPIIPLSFAFFLLRQTLLHKRFYSFFLLCHCAEQTKAFSSFVFHLRSIHYHCRPPPPPSLLVSISIEIEIVDWVRSLPIAVHDWVRSLPIAVLRLGWFFFHDHVMVKFLGIGVSSGETNKNYQVFDKMSQRNLADIYI